MSKHLNYEKSNLKRLKHVELVSGPMFEYTDKPKPTRQQQMQKFVDKRSISCFKCKLKRTEWAKTGTNQGRAWAICVACLDR